MRDSDILRSKYSIRRCWFCVLYFRKIILRRLFDYIPSAFQYLLWWNCVTYWSITNFWGYVPENRKHKPISDCYSELELFLLLSWIDKMDVSERISGRDMLWKGLRAGWGWGVGRIYGNFRSHVGGTQPLSRGTWGCQYHVMDCEHFFHYWVISGSSATLTAAGWKGSLYERRNTRDLSYGAWFFLSHNMQRSIL